LYGTNAATTGTAYGVLGSTQSADGYGVTGNNQSTDGGYGVFGTSDNGGGVLGVTVVADAAVTGTASSTDAGATGVYATSAGKDSVAVFGEATGTDGTGGFFEGTAAGVYATAKSPARALVAEGDSLLSGTTEIEGNGTVTGSLSVTGQVSKGGGAFKIDHPLDPSQKYLYHSFVESPDMMNIYNGTLTLDGQGRATVRLPGWFEALNRDYRYQLTAIGLPAPDLHIAQEVVDGTFAIAGGKTGQKVSWQVTGIRQDAWANANRIPVEADKSPADRGRYLHPELFGGERVAGTGEARRPSRPTGPRSRH
jgi:hypothetical protein